MIIKGDMIAGELAEGVMSKDPLVITPEPDLEELRKSGSASVDLRLGTWISTMRGSSLKCLDVLEPKSQNSGESLITKSHYIPFGSDFILHPNSFVLGVTLEWIRMPSKLAAYVVGKSTWGRRGLIIATATGVHPGFTGCLTLEITNLGELPISIRPGMRICQLFLHRVETTSEGLDRSALSGNRKPILGTVKPDEIALKLSNRHSP